MRFRQVDGSTSHFSLQLPSRDRLDRPLGPGVSVLTGTGMPQSLRAREDTVTRAKRKAKGDARSARLPICPRLDY
jgi:hypothetical protein